jgi:predicted O-methyltransferase YrrM
LKEKSVVRAIVDVKVQSVLDEYEQRAKIESQRMQESAARGDFLANRDALLLPIGPATGTLVNVLVKESKAKRILEFGTSYGYSSVWLGEAARAIGGKVTTLEIHPDKAKYARSMWSKAGIAEYVDCIVGDAQASVAALPGPFDFVLVDLWKELYVPCFELVYPKLAPGALIVADNMLYPEVHRDHATAYRKLVKSKAQMTSVLLPVGSGIEVSRFGGE